MIKTIDKVTLATTIVEECKSEDTGVGLSIAIGNHQLKIKSEDLPKTEKHNNKIILKVKILKLKFKIKISINKSLKRLKNTAQIDEELASRREPHQEINKND